MPKKSAGLLVYRITSGKLELLLGHPGGPFYKNKDKGVWSIPKGEFDDEEPLTAALREFEEETGIKVEGRFDPLDPVRQKSGKIVYAWAVEADVDVSEIESNTFPLEWPPRSGRFIDCPELDRAEWFTPDAAREKILSYQLGLIDSLEEILVVD